MFVHGNNLEQKENHLTKYRDAKSKKYLAEIRKKYDAWKAANEKLIGPVSKKSDGDSTVIASRVKLLNRYKNFLDQQRFAEQFDSRSNLHSSVLEEFMLYLFRDIVYGISRKYPPPPAGQLRPNNRIVVTGTSMRPSRMSYVKRGESGIP